MPRRAPQPGTGGTTRAHKPQSGHHRLSPSSRPPRPPGAEGRSDPGRRSHPTLHRGRRPTTDPPAARAHRRDHRGLRSHRRRQASPGLKNEGRRPLNARYVFPASTRAAVHGLKMVIGDEVIEARIRSARPRGRSTSSPRARQERLAPRADRPNVFSMRWPHHALTADHRRAALHRATGPRGRGLRAGVPDGGRPRYANESTAVTSPLNQFVATPYLRAGAPAPSTFELTGVVSAGLPLHDLASPRTSSTRWCSRRSQARFDPTPPRPRAGNRASSCATAWRRCGRPPAPVRRREGGGELLLLTVQPPARRRAEVIPAARVLVHRRRVGSISLPAGHRQAALGRPGRQLRPSDRFNIVLFSGDTATDGAASVPATAGTSTRHRAHRGGRGGGGTELLARSRPRWPCRPTAPRRAPSCGHRRLHRRRARAVRWCARSSARQRLRLRIGRR